MNRLQVKVAVITGLWHPEEIASAALFLASEESSYVVGIDLFVDWGIAQV